jgi:uncharacterized repeat protein (TIGR01451 family)
VRKIRFNDTATVNGTNTGVTTTGPVAPATLSGPSYSITKTASIATGLLSVNNDFIYSILITNPGNGTGTYRVTDILPDDTTMLSWSGGATRFEYDSNINVGGGVTIFNTTTGYPGPTLTFPSTTTSHTIAAGVTDRIRFNARLNTAVNGVYFNQASVADTLFITGTASTGLSAPIVVGTPPSLTISKTVDQSLVLPLDDVFYTVRITNTSASVAAANVDVSDTLPAGFNYQPGSSQLSVNGGAFGAIGNPTGTFGTITWNNVVASLAAGQYIDVRFRVQVSNTPGSYDNVARTFGGNFGNVTTGPTATVVVGNPPTLTISKTNNRAPPIPLATQVDVQYTIVVNNTGSLAANGINISDTIPTGTTYQTGTSQLDTGSGYGATGDPSGTTGTITWAALGNIPAGGTMNLRFTVRFPNTMTSGTYPNYASASGSNVSVVSTGPTAPVTVGTPPNMRISQSLSAASITAPGTVTVTVTVTVTILSFSGGDGLVDIVDAFLPLGMNYVGGSTVWTNGGAAPPLTPTTSGTDPMSVTWDFPTPRTLSAGQSMVLTFQAQVLATAIDADSVVNGYYIESRTIGANYSLITTGTPPGTPTAGSGSPPILQVSSSSSVGLHNLIAVAKPNSVDVHWRTGSEWQNMGFLLTRADKPNGPFSSVGQPPSPG